MYKYKLNCLHQNFQWWRKEHKNICGCITTHIPIKFCRITNFKSKLIKSIKLSDVVSSKNVIGNECWKLWGNESFDLVTMNMKCNWKYNCTVSFTETKNYQIIKESSRKFNFLTLRKFQNKHRKITG